MLVLAARLQALAEEQASADASADRASQIRTVDRSERIRTYNFPENRVTDHRIGYKAHNLDQLLDGDVDALFDALSAADKQSRLQQA
jgi:peptide chain release factor 1